MSENVASDPSSSPALVLATDLDGTFAGGTAEDRARLQRALRELPGSTLVYVTGRSLPATHELMREAGLPEPDILICDVGTTVVRGRGPEPVEEVEREIAATWPGAEAVRARLEGAPGLEEQDVRPPRRVSYWVTDGDVEGALERAAERLADLTVELVGSAGTYLDVLPGGVNKGTTLRRVLRWLGRPDSDVVVAGDTFNDLALFEAGLSGVVVGNCEPGLRERVGGRDRIYCAAGHGAAGILEGLRHFGWIEEATHGE